MVSRGVGVAIKIILEDYPGLAGTTNENCTYRQKNDYAPILHYHTTSRKPFGFQTSIIHATIIITSI